MAFTIPDRPIHLSWDNPTTGRPRTFCGAKLRTGGMFVWFENHLVPVRHDEAPLVVVKQRGRENRNHTDFVTLERYDRTLCKRCQKSDDYILATLAAVP